jgi:hypothetical protein
MQFNTQLKHFIQNYLPTYILTILAASEKPTNVHRSQLQILRSTPLLFSLDPEWGYDMNQFLSIHTKAVVNRPQLQTHYLSSLNLLKYMCNRHLNCLLS